MPAAAVTPAPIVYLNVVAVKKLVVEFLGGCFKVRPDSAPSSALEPGWVFSYRPGEGAFYFEEIRVFQASICLNTSAWNNGIGQASFYWLLNL